ncbi:hypothetical protein NM208_g4708 [Fusarium decemcellulare]|uniref:Uncharacterized protein n=1 Tax=Fusarium decemcellulare TaxID=57161 RepID=A0ACC1SK07_9HYPO|nr:hypothetical protein NM208_g4708 [Fusarium decemcellulare]
MDLAGKTVFIAGGSTGLGKELALSLARRGCHITIFARRQKQLDLTKQEVLAARKDESQQITTQSLDLTDPSELQSTFESQPSLPDVLYCVAGGSTNELGFLVDLDPAAVQRCMTNNYLTSAYSAQAMLKLWIENDKELQQNASRKSIPKHRKIVFVSSAAAFVALPGYVAYTPAKCAVRALADTLRSELKRYSGPEVQYSVHISFPSNFMSPSFLEEQDHKPELTKRLEGTTAPITHLSKTLHSSKHVADYIIHGVDKNEFIICSEYEAALLFAAMSLSSVEGIYDRFLSAISCFIGRLYAVSQSQEELSSALDHATACSEDLVLSINKTWQRLRIDDRIILPLSLATRYATRRLASTVDKLVNTGLDGYMPGLSPNLSHLLSLAIKLFYTASSLVSRARAVLCRPDCRQRELRPQGQPPAVVNENTALQDCRNRSRASKRPNRALFSFPKRTTSLGSRAKHDPSTTQQYARAPKRSSNHEPQQTTPSPCAAPRTTTSADHANFCPSGAEYHPHLSPEACEVVRIARIGKQPSSSCKQTRQQDNTSVTKHVPLNVSINNLETKPFNQNIRPGGCEGYIRKPTSPLTMHKGTGAVQNCLIAAERQSTKRLTTIDETSDARRLSSRDDSLSHPRLHLNENAEVTGGTLPGLVGHLTSRQSASEIMFPYAFFLTFRQFCKPRELAEQLVERFDSANDSSFAEDTQLRVCDGFKLWLEMYWRAETDQEALPVIKPFITSSLSSIIPAASRKLARLIEHLPAREPCLLPLADHDKLITTVFDSPRVRRHRAQPNDSATHQWGFLRTLRNSKSSSTFLSFGCIEFARQLSIEQTTLFCRIPPQEFLGCAWVCKTGNMAPNVRAMVSFTSQLSNLVVETILDHQTARKRAVAINHWVNIAQECSNFRNYDGLVALLSGLGHSAILRLRQTWNLVSPKYINTLQFLKTRMDRSDNHKSLRALLETHDNPCLPFLGMYLTELAFVEMGQSWIDPQNPHDETTSEQPFIDFAKYARTAKILF